MPEQSTTEQSIARGKEAFAQKEYGAALAALHEAVAQRPGFADLHHLIGLCLALLGRPEEAVEAFDRALEINPRYVEALVSRAITLNDLGRLDEARASFAAASEADMEEGVGRFPAVLAGRLANEHKELGDLYAEGGAVAEAAEQYQRALELRPRYVDIRARLARALLELGEADSAAGELEEILEINPHFVGARIQLGLAWYRMGDHERARREWERCRADRPDDPQAEVYLKLIADS